MREIRVKNATILAKIRGRKIDFEVRDNKAVRGFALFIDGKKWLDCDVGGAGGIMDGGHYTDDKALFRIRDVKSNGVL